ncbi:MAG: ABC transporter substrate-binding protein [Myxococcales bacterium]
MPNALRRLVALWLLALLAGCPRAAQEGQAIGVLLPRTGTLADSGGHAESAVLLAAEKVNLAGGVGGKPITLVIKDTRSQGVAGSEAARKLLTDSDDLLAVLGPEEDDVADTLVALAKEKKRVQVSGGVTAVRFATVDDGGYFFRTCPSSRVTANAIVTRMLEDGMDTASFLFVRNDFGVAFISSAAQAYGLHGGTLLSPGTFDVPIAVEPGLKDYREVLNEVLSFKPKALLIAADPLTGARLVSDWKLLGGNARLYLAPPLMTDAFVQDVPAGALEGAVGVSALSGDADGSFAKAYSEAVGEQPAQSAYFYYDAMALVALAIERATTLAGGAPDGDQVRAALVDVASPPGTKVHWNELGQALERIRAGEDIDYDGASGEIDFDPAGDVTSKAVGLWRVSASTIVR